MNNTINAIQPSGSSLLSGVYALESVATDFLNRGNRASARTMLTSIAALYERYYAEFTARYGSLDNATLWTASNKTLRDFIANEFADAFACGGSEDEFSYWMTVYAKHQSVAA